MNIIVESLHYNVSDRHKLYNIISIYTSDMKAFTDWIKSGVFIKGKGPKINGLIGMNSEDELRE